MKDISERFVGVINNLKEILYENIKVFTNYNDLVSIKFIINHKIDSLANNDIEILYIPSSLIKGEFKITIYEVEYIAYLSLLDGVVDITIDDYYLYPIDELYDFYLNARRDNNNIVFTNVNSDVEFFECMQTFPYMIKDLITKSSFYKSLKRKNTIDEILN